MGFGESGKTKTMQIQSFCCLQEGKVFKGQYSMLNVDNKVNQSLVSTLLFDTEGQIKV